MRKIVEVMNITTPFALVNTNDTRNLVSRMSSTDLIVSRRNLLPSRMTGDSNIGRDRNKNTHQAIMSPPHPLTLPSPMWSTPVNEGVQGSTIHRSMHLDPH